MTVESGSSFAHTGSSPATVTIKGDISSAGTGNVSITSGSGGIQVNGGTTQTFGGGGGSGTITFVSPLTVASGTTLAAARTLTTSGGATINGSFQLNSNGFTTGGTWTYGFGATLIFNNTGSRYGVSSGHVYWPASNGPANVRIANTGGVQMGVSRTVAGTLTASAATSLELNNGNTLTAGSLSISNSSSLNLATATTGTTGALTVSGDVSVGTSGGLTLSSADIYVGGNWSHSGTFTPNSRAVFFNGTGTQTISKTGGETFAYLIVNKTAGTVQLLSGVTVNATSGDVLQLLNTGGMDLNGNTLTLSGAGGNVLASGAARSITGGSGSTVAIAGSKTVTSANSGTLSFGSNVLVTLSAGVNFGASLSTVNGTLRIDGGGAVTTNPPTYGGGSLLQYYSGGNYGRGAEWNATSGAGYPANVQISNNTTLNYPNGSIAARSMAGSLTVDAGSALYMDYGSPSPGVSNPLSVAGNVTLNGSLSLGNAVGGDLNVGGNWTFNTGANFFPNSRAVTFNGSSAQTIGGSADTTFAYLTINNTRVDSAGVSLGRNQVVNNVLTLTDGLLKVAGFNLTLGTGATISGGTSTSSMVVTDTDGSASGDGFLCKRYSGNCYSPTWRMT